MDDQFNTFAGWTLFAGIVALGGTIASGMYFAHHPVEKGGYEVADATPGEGGGAAAKPTDFSAGDPAKGEALFSKCVSCHSINAGGPNAIGPNIHGVMGKPLGKVAGFAYSPALLEKGGTWDWAAMDAWLANPKRYIPGTKMSFAGLSNPEDRANIIRYINDQGSNLPVPPPPAADAAAASADVGNTAAAALSGSENASAAAPGEPPSGNVTAPPNAPAK
jgi:cytochrome c